MELTKIQRWKFYCFNSPVKPCTGQHTTEPDGEWVQWKDVCAQEHKKRNVEELTQAVIKKVRETSTTITDNEISAIVGITMSIIDGEIQCIQQ